MEKFNPLTVFNMVMEVEYDLYSIDRFEAYIRSFNLAHITPDSFDKIGNEVYKSEYMRGLFMGWRMGIGEMKKDVLEEVRPHLI